MKNDCLHKCLKEVGLEKYYIILMNKGISNCDLLTKITINQYPEFGINQVEDKLKLFELIKIIKSIQADLVNGVKDTTNNQDETKKEEIIISQDDNKAEFVKESDDIELSYKEELNVCRKLIDCSLDQDYMKISNKDKSSSTDINFIDSKFPDKNKTTDTSLNFGNNINNLEDYSQNKEFESKQKHLKNYKQQYDPQMNHHTNNSDKDSQQLNTSTSNDYCRQLDKKNNIINKLNPTKSPRFTAIKNLKTVISNPSSNSINAQGSKYSSTIGRFNGLSIKSNSKNIAANNNCKLDGRFTSDEIQLSSTPLKPLPANISNIKSSNKPRNLYGNLKNIKITSNNINNSSSNDIEVVSGHLMFSQKNQRNLNNNKSKNLQQSAAKQLNICEYININDSSPNGQHSLIKKCISMSPTNIKEDDRNITNNISPPRRRNTFDKTVDGDQHIIKQKCMPYNMSETVSDVDRLNCQTNLEGNQISENIKVNENSQIQPNTNRMTAQNLFSQTITDIVTSRRNVLQAFASDSEEFIQKDLLTETNESKIFLKTDRSIASPATTDDIHLETSTHFRPIKTPISSTNYNSLSSIQKKHQSFQSFSNTNSVCNNNIRQLSEESLSNKIGTTPSNCSNISVYSAFDTKKINNLNVSSNKFLRDDVIDIKDDDAYLTTSSFITSPNRSQYANSNIDAPLQYITDLHINCGKFDEMPNKKCLCIGCLEWEHELQLSEITHLSSLELNSLISFRQQNITSDEYVSEVKKFLELKSSKINQVLQSFNQFNSCQN